MVFAGEIGPDKSAKNHTTNDFPLLWRFCAVPGHGYGAFPSVPYSYYSPHPPQCAHWGTFPQGKALLIHLGMLLRPLTAEEKALFVKDAVHPHHGRGGQNQKPDHTHDTQVEEIPLPQEEHDQAYRGGGQPSAQNTAQDDPRPAGGAGHLHISHALLLPTVQGSSGNCRRFSPCGPCLTPVPGRRRESPLQRPPLPPRGRYGRRRSP